MVYADGTAAVRSMQKEKIVLVYFKIWNTLRSLRSWSGQAMIESTFSIIVIVLLILSMIRVFFWVGSDLARRRAAHEQTLITPIVNPNAGNIDEVYRQIRPMFYEGSPMDATTISSDIFGVNRLR